MISFVVGFAKNNSAFVFYRNNNLSNYSEKAIVEGCLLIMFAFGPKDKITGVLSSREC